MSAASACHRECICACQNNRLLLQHLFDYSPGSDSDILTNAPITLVINKYLRVYMPKNNRKLFTLRRDTRRWSYGYIPVKLSLSLSLNLCLSFLFLSRSLSASVPRIPPSKRNSTKQSLAPSTIHQRAHIKGSKLTKLLVEPKLLKNLLSKTVPGVAATGIFGCGGGR